MGLNPVPPKHWFNWRLSPPRPSWDPEEVIPLWAGSNSRSSRLFTGGSVSHRRPLEPPGPLPRPGLCRSEELDFGVPFPGYLFFPEDGGARTPGRQDAESIPPWGWGWWQTGKKGTKSLSRAGLPPERLTWVQGCFADLQTPPMSLAPAPHSKHPSPKVDKGMRDPHPLC